MNPVSSVSMLVDEVWARTGDRKRRRRGPPPSGQTPSSHYELRELDPEQARPPERNDHTLRTLADALGREDSWESVRYALVLRSKLERLRRLYYAEYERTQRSLERLSSGDPGSGAGGSRTTAAEFEPGEADLPPLGGAFLSDEAKLQQTIASRVEDALRQIDETLALLKPKKTGMDKMAGFNQLRLEMRDSLLRLDKFIGLAELKQGVADLIKKLLVEENVEMPGDLNNNPSLSKLLASIKLAPAKKLVPDSALQLAPSDRRKVVHKNFLFFGEPGTGKSTAAETIGAILGGIGHLPERVPLQLLASSRSDLVGQFAGQTAIKTRLALARALGTLLFIDEAYSLVSRVGADDFGQEAIDTLVGFLTDFQGLIGVVAAGYEREIKERLYTANQGFESRFPSKFFLRNYSADELQSIIQQALARQNAGYSWEDAAPDVLQSILDQAVQRKPSLFQNRNARGAINLLEKIKEAQAARSYSVVTRSNTLQSPLKLITVEDVKEGFRAWVAQTFGDYEVLFEDDYGDDDV